MWFIGRCLTRALSMADRLSLIKLKSLYAPELMSLRTQWLSSEPGHAEKMVGNDRLRTGR
jgi:hypothetical protein